MSEEQSVTKLIEDVASEVCDKLCRFQWEANTYGQGSDKAEDELMKHCEECPIMRLV